MKTVLRKEIEKIDLVMKIMNMATMLQIENKKKGITQFELYNYTSFDYLLSLDALKLNSIIKELNGGK